MNILKGELEATLIQLLFFNSCGLRFSFISNVGNFLWAMLGAASIISEIFVLCKYANVHTHDDILHFLFVHNTENLIPQSKVW